MENDSSWLTDVSKGNIQNQYILGDIIGRGTTSTIHICLYKGKKKFACKVIPKVKLNRAEAKSTIETLLYIRHENLVTVKEAYDDPLRLYIIEDLASGGELLERLASCGEYSERDAARAILDTAKALEYIHSMNICHGNLRSEKLVYASDHYDSKLLLTGIWIANTTMNPYKMLYCAPEVKATGKPTPASDMWSLGVVLYIMLCGFEPFRNTAKLFPSPYWDDKTEEAKRLTTWLMQQCPEDRPTAKCLLKNPWVKGEKGAEHSMADAAQHLREFNARRKFKAATIVVRATQRASVLS